MKEGAKGTYGWAWPDELDALTAAPKHHRRLLENERVRVLEVRIGPGEIVPVHTHRWPSVIYMQTEHILSAGMAKGICCSIRAQLDRRPNCL